MTRILALIICASACQSAVADTFRNYKIQMDKPDPNASYHSFGAENSDFTSGRWWGSSGEDQGNFLNKSRTRTIYGMWLKLKYPKKVGGDGDTFTADSTGGAAFPNVWRKKDGSELIFRTSAGIAPRRYFWMQVPKTSDTDDRDRFFAQLYSENGKPDVPDDGTWEKIPRVVSGDPKPTPITNFSLKVKLVGDKPISPKGGPLPVELQFYNNSATSDQKFRNAEYRFEIVDKEGMQVMDALILRPVDREIVLKKADRSTIDRPDVSLIGGKLKAGEEYSLVVSVRNLLGLVTFKAGEEKQSEPGLFKIAQQTVYQVAPLKIRVTGKEDFKVHRIELIAQVPGDYARPFQNGDPVPKEEKSGMQANGKIYFYGKCDDADGLWHWGDCARYGASFSMDVRVGRRYEYDPSGLKRPGYVIRAVKDGRLADLDADGKVFFFNGPPTNTLVPHHSDCPFRLVINTQGQNEVVQALTMEPIAKPGPARPRAKPPTKLSTVVQQAIDSYHPMPVGPTLADHIADELVKWLNSRPDR